MALRYRVNMLIGAPPPLVGSREMSSLELHLSNGQTVQIDPVSVNNAILTLGERLLDSNANQLADAVMALLQSLGIPVDSVGEMVTVVAKIMAEANRVIE